MNSVAFSDALDCISLVILRREAGDAAEAETALLEASVPASEAFPVGSPEANALGVLLAAAARVPAVTA